MAFVGTFGVKYIREEHPSGKDVNPDGYVLIEAETYDEARLIMEREYGRDYAFIYSEEDFALPNMFGKTGYDYHPVGPFATLTPAGIA